MTTHLLDIPQRKSAARKQAFAARKTAQNQAANIAACGHLTDLVSTLPEGATVAGYMPIQTEIDPRASLNVLHDRGYRLCLPVIQGHNQPLLFREWTPQSAMIEGDFGALIPRGGDHLTPELAIIPLVGFDLTGARLGYGGGFYDRTLAEIAASKQVQKIGFAFAGQQIDTVPTDKYDQCLDAIVTENGVRKFE